MDLNASEMPRADARIFFSDQGFATRIGERTDQLRQLREQNSSLPIDATAEARKESLSALSRAAYVLAQEVDLLQRMERKSISEELLEALSLAQAEMHQVAKILPPEKLQEAQRDRSGAFPHQRGGLDESNASTLAKLVAFVLNAILQLLTLGRYALGKSTDQKGPWGAPRRQDDASLDA